MPWSRNASAGRQRRRPGRAAEEEARRKLEEAAALEKSGDVAGAEAALQDAEVSEDVSRMVFVPGGAPKAKVCPPARIGRSSASTAKASR